MTCSTQPRRMICTMKVCIPFIERDIVAVRHERMSQRAKNNLLAYCRRELSQEASKLLHRTRETLTSSRGDNGERRVRDTAAVKTVLQVGYY